MKFEVNVEKRYAYIIISLLIIVAGLLVVNAAYTSQIPNPGHGGDRVLVKVGTQEVTLQKAIDDGLLSGGGEGSVVSCRQVDQAVDEGTKVCCNTGEVVMFAAFAAGQSGLDTTPTYKLSDGSKCVTPTEGTGLGEKGIAFNMICCSGINLG